MGVYWLVFFCSNRCPLLTSYTSWTRWHRRCWW
jgi:hypothetical protein